MKIRFVFIVCFLGLQTILGAQNYVTTKTATEKIATQFKEARKLFFGGNPDEAVKELEKVVKKQDNYVDAYLLLGEIYESKKQYEQARDFYKKAMNLSETYKPEVFFWMARSYYAQKNYAEAQPLFKSYITQANAKPETVVLAQEMLKESALRQQLTQKAFAFEPKNLGPNINTENFEHLPSLSIDGKTLLFTRQIGFGDNSEDFYKSELQPDGAWGKAVNLGAPLNSEANEGSVSLTADGKLMILTRCNSPENLGGCDLYGSHKVGNTWEKPANLGPLVNSPLDDRMCSIAPHGEFILFSSKRPGGKGGEDLWATFLTPEGVFGKPVNLAKLNTPGNESSPFLHFDGRTLYFRSDGHPGMGGTDLFMSKLDPTTNDWSEPINLGAPLNSENDEGGLIVSPDGQTGFFNSQRKEGNFGKSDLYTFKLPLHLQPTPVTYLQAKVIDAVSKQPIQATVRITRHNTPKQSTINTVSDAANGQFLVVLPIGQNYALQVEKKDYMLHSQQFVLDETKLIDQPYTMTIELMPLPSNNQSPKTGTTFTMQNILFETNSAILKPESETELGIIVKLMKEHHAIKLDILGHTDNVGNEKENQLLSEQRAIAVKNYLTQQGVSQNRLSAKGFGESKPISDNATPQGRANNRRTEFVVQ